MSKNTEKQPNLFIPMIIDEDKENCIIVDVDGTLAYSEGRPWYNPTEEEMMQDKVIEQVSLIIETVPRDLLKIFMVTGRFTKYKEVTKRWLETNEIPFDEVYTRPDGDNRSDIIVKTEIITTEILPKYNVIYAIEDRLKVIKGVYNALGIFVLNVNQTLADY